jgi:hypothetical protein
MCYVVRPDTRNVSVTWEWQAEDKWIPYDMPSCLQIEKAFQEGSASVTLNQGYFADKAGYTVHFGPKTKGATPKKSEKKAAAKPGGKKSEMYQINTGTQGTRRVRRIGSDDSELFQSIDLSILTEGDVCSVCQENLVPATTTTAMSDSTNTNSSTTTSSSNTTSNDTSPSKKSESPEKSSSIPDKASHSSQTESAHSSSSDDGNSGEESPAKKQKISKGGKKSKPSKSAKSEAKAAKEEAPKSTKNTSPTNKNSKSDKNDKTDDSKEASETVAKDSQMEPCKLPKCKPGHYFHRGCIAQWCKLKDICPYCKVKLA